MLHLPKDLDGRFNLVLVLDVLYYLSPLDAELLKQRSRAYRRSTSSGGLCVLVNHYFIAIDSNSRLSRRILGRSKTLRTSVSSPSIAGRSSWSVSSRLLPVQHF